MTPARRVACPRVPRFVIAGDLNADPQIGDGDLTAIQALHNHAGQPGRHQRP
jgi:hypothetical protein